MILMSKKWKDWKYWFYAGLLLLIGGLLYMIFLKQLAIAETRHLSDTESISFNFGYILLSIIFGIAFNRITTYDQFQADQKNRAIAAYRRAIDIQKALNRLSELVTSPQFRKSIDYYKIQSILISIQTTQDAINSSIDDWADFIGDERDSIEKLTLLKVAEDAITNAQFIHMSKDAKADFSNRISGIESRIESIKNSLPPSLRTAYDYPIPKQTSLSNVLLSSINFESYRFCEVNVKPCKSFGYSFDTLLTVSECLERVLSQLSNIVPEGSVHISLTKKLSSISVSILYELSSSLRDNERGLQSSLAHLAEKLQKRDVTVQFNIDEPFVEVEIRVEDVDYGVNEE